jgi:type II secretion system protein G
MNTRNKRQETSDKKAVSHVSCLMSLRKGFTLIELLVVIAILGILVTIGLVSFMSSQKKSRDLKRKNDLRQISLALEAYFNDKGTYPAGNSDGNIMGCSPDDVSLCAWGAEFKDKNNTIYMLTLPGDSVGGQKYVYMPAVDKSSYQLYARLENTLDNDIPKDAQSKSRVFTDITCDTANAVYCNYGLSSSNKAVTEGRTVVYE